MEEEASSLENLRGFYPGLASRTRDLAPLHGLQVTWESSAQRAPPTGRVRGYCPDDEVDARARTRRKRPTGRPRSEPDDRAPRPKATTCPPRRDRQGGGGPGGTRGAGFTARELLLGRRELRTRLRGRARNTAPLRGVPKGPGRVSKGREGDRRREPGPPRLCPRWGAGGTGAPHWSHRRERLSASAAVGVFRSRKNASRWSGTGRRSYARTRVHGCVDRAARVYLNVHSCVAWGYARVTMRLCACVCLSARTCDCVCVHTCVCASVSVH